MMAVPKQKTSRARRDKRRTHFKLTAPAIVECPQCHEAKAPHHACRHCGYYRGRQRIQVGE